MGFSSDDYAAAGRTPNLMAEAIAKKAQIGQENDAKLKQLLQGKQADMANLKVLQDTAPEGASVKAGDYGYGVDPVTKAVNTNQRGEAQAINAVQNTYGKDAGKLKSEFDMYENSIKGISDPTNTAARGQFVSALSHAVQVKRMSEAEANRLLHGTVGGTLKDWANKTVNTSYNPLNEAQINSAKSALQQAQSAIGDEHDALVDRAMGHYEQSPYMNPEKSQVLRKSLPGGFGAQIAQKRQQLADMQSKQAQQPQKQPGALDKFLGMFSGAGPTNPANAPQQQAPQETPAQELARRRAQKGR